MLLILLLFLKTFNFSSSTILQSDSNTLSGICDNIVSTLQVLNKNEILKLVDRERCGDYELLGENILKMSNKEDSYCYKGVQFLFCNLKFQPYEANFNCEHIKEKFMKIVKTCSSQDPNALDKNCSSLNSENLTIADPLEFCRTNYVTLNGEKQTQFDPVEHDYCSKIVETFNMCQYVSRRLNLKNYCMEGGFQSYCSHYVKEVRDNNYEAMCKNFVLPFVFSKLTESQGNLERSVCLKADENISKYILSARDKLMFKSKSFLDSFESEFAYKKWTKDLESRLDKMVLDLRDLIHQSYLCFSYLNYPHRFFYAYDQVVVSLSQNLIFQLGEFGKGKELVDKAYNYFLQLSQLPKEIFKLLGEVEKIINLDDCIKEATIHFKDLYALIESGSHYYFSFRGNPKLHQDIQVMENNLNRMNLYLPGNIANIKGRINSASPFETNLWRAGMLHERANNFRNIAALLEAQLNALYKLMAKSRDSNFVKSLNLT